MNKRLKQQLGIATISIALTAAIFAIVESKDSTFRLSMATAYVGLALLALSLILGPLNVLRGLPNPVNTTLRRDIGIWGGILGILHTVVGLQVHMSGRFWLYFMFPREENQVIPMPRYDAFGFANYTGLAVACVLILLLSLSRDVALTRLGPQRWKWWQRWNYAGFALLVAHGAAYQFLEKRTAGYILLFAMAVFVVGTLQTVGFRKILHKQSAGLPASTATNR